MESRNHARAAHIPSARAAAHPNRITKQREVAVKQISTKARISFHRISAAALSLEGFRLALAVLLIAAAAFGGFHFFAVAQAQDTDGAITGLTLGSDSPRTLNVSWNMPSPHPTDYRIDWAKSSESYQSYTVNEGHVYPEGDVTTVTITELEGGEEYKVRMRARYHDGEHTDSPWSGPWSEGRRTVAAEPEPTPEPTEEPTPEPGAIGSATAAADDPQTLAITWEKPADPHENPTDYRVNWARSEDDYPSYTEEQGNAHPTGATQTLEGLDHDTEYKIRIRARYSPNDQYDEHWSGPWTEITARVVSIPPSAPAAPTLVGTAVTPKGHVTLLWLDPSDDSVTGYQVLRGPDAESLAVIREDTGSTAVSYTDTEAEAGQTYTYAVEARSAAGLSPMSNTRTATVPANEEEPVPQRQQHESSDATLSGLTIGPEDIIGFAADRTTYEVGVASTETRATIAATATNSDAAVAYSGTDADTTTTVHDVDLSAGRNSVTITVTSQDGSATEEYTVSVNRGVSDDYGWKAVDDLDGLTAAGNDNALGIWSDGATMWVADWVDEKIYAYHTDGTRDASKEFDTLGGAGNNDPTGIWSDGTTMWVADFGDEKIYAYRMSDKAHDSGRDFNTLAGAGNNNPFGIWSDGDTMWVADEAERKVYAYNLNTKARDASKEFSTSSTDIAIATPAGIWSDGTTMWVANRFHDKLYAYRMSNKARDASKDFNTLGAANNGHPTGIWSDGETVWVVDWFDDKVYSYNMPPNSDATLSALTISPEDIIGFDPDRTDYEVGVASTVSRATVAAAANHPAAGVAYSGADADLAADGQQVDLSAGRNAVTITVTAQDGSATKTYTVSVNRGVADAYGWKAVDDLEGPIAAGNNNPFGIWSDGATMWVADTFDDKLYAYNTDGTRDGSRDFNTLAAAGNGSARGIWSDGATMWVVDSDNDKLYAYNTDGTRDSARDFNTLSGASNNYPTGIWSDGDTMWVADLLDSKIYAYRMSDQTHDSGRDFNTLSGAGNNDPTGIWSDDTTMWVADWLDDKIYAYRMSDKERDSGRDFNTLAGIGNNNPYGIWSDSTTMWVVDNEDDKVYSYNMPLRSSDATLSALTVSPEDIIGFAPDRTTYEVGVASTETRATIAATATNSDAAVAYSGTDADTTTTVHDVDLSAGRNSVTITVTSQDGSATEEYTVSVNRGVSDDYGWKAALDLDGLIAAGNTSPFGIWSDDTTMWVADSFDDKLYAYNTAGTRDSGRDFDTLGGATNSTPTGIWSDGDTMWVADSSTSKIYAYNLDTKARDASKDFNTLGAANNGHPSGIWSDGETMWVADFVDSKLLRLPDVRQDSRQRQGLRHARRGDQQHPHRHLVRRRHHVGGRF